MKQIHSKLLFQVLLLSGMLALPSCHSHYQLTHIQGSSIEITSAFDAKPDAGAVAVLAPYKAQIDSIMTPVIGHSDVLMQARRPESLLSNLVADVLRQSAASAIGEEVQVAVINMGGIRNDLPKGDITVSTVYEILPFENSLCVLTLKGSDLQLLFKSLARENGEGLSGAQLLIAADGNLASAQIGGKEIEADRFYRVATLDYLAEGNSGMSAFLNASEKVCPEGATIRKIFLDYVKAQTAQGKSITSKIDGRITSNNK